MSEANVFALKHQQRRVTGYKIAKTVLDAFLARSYAFLVYLLDSVRFQSEREFWRCCTNKFFHCQRQVRR